MLQIRCGFGSSEVSIEQALHALVRNATAACGKASFVLSFESSVLPLEDPSTLPGLVLMTDLGEQSNKPSNVHSDGCSGRSNVKSSSLSKVRLGNAVVGWMFELLMKSFGVTADSMECLAKELT